MQPRPGGCDIRSINVGSQEIRQLGESLVLLHCLSISSQNPPSLCCCFAVWHHFRYLFWRWKRLVRNMIDSDKLSKGEVLIPALAPKRNNRLAALERQKTADQGDTLKNNSNDVVGFN